MYATLYSYSVAVLLKPFGCFFRFVGLQSHASFAGSWRATMATSRLHALASTGALWSQLSLGLQAGLVGAGMDDPALLRGLFDGSAAEAKEVALEFGGRADDLGALVALWGAAEGPGRRSVEALASVPTVLATARGTVASRKRGLTHTDSPALRPCTIMDFGVAVPRAGHPSWPKPRASPKPLDGVPNARALAEHHMRNKWLVELRGFILNAGLPIATLLQGSCSTEVLLASVGQDRRARTIRRPVIDFRHIANCFAISLW